MSRFRVERRLGLLLAIVAVVAAACVDAGSGRVKINPIEANLVFGVKPPAPVAPLASDALSGLLPDILEGNVDLPTLPGLGLLTQPKVCPDAPLTAVVERPSEVNAAHEPLVGVSRWKHSGFVTNTATGNKVPFTGFERRIVRNYKKISDTEWTFDTIQPIQAVVGSESGAGQFLQSSFAVKTNGFSYTIYPPAGPVAPPTIGAPDQGLVLTRLQTLDSAGEPVGTPFAPLLGILLLPLPVASGATWNSVAVDPASGQTVIHRGQVLSRGRIDACGDLVDGWRVSSTQISVGLNPTGATTGGVLPLVPTFKGYDYIVATQFGGMLIDERTYVADPIPLTPDAVVAALGSDPIPRTPSPIDLDFTLGQLKPDPLPAG